MRQDASPLQEGAYCTPLAQLDLGKENREEGLEMAREGKGTEGEENKG